VLTRTSGCGRWYVADQSNHRILELDLEGRFLTEWGKHGTKPAKRGGNNNVNSRAEGPDFDVDEQ
jgi:hypothetical protein